MTDIASLSAAELAAAYRARTLSPVEVVRDAFARIERFEPTINAFTLTDAEGALKSAQASEDRWRKREPLSDIDGVLGTVKANIASLGWPARRGCPALPDSPMTFDSPAAARLREAGCIFIGQTTTPEFTWIGVTHSRLHGVTRNPWRTDRTPGGSSGGAAAAAALRIGHFHLGTDGAGSIRIPASFSGVFGIMGSAGRVPAFPASPFGVLARVGPLTPSVADGARMLEILSQKDDRDVAFAGLPAPDLASALNQGIRGLRIAFSPTLATATRPVQAEVAQAVAGLAHRLTEFGAIVEEATPPFSLEQAWKPLSALWDAGCASVLRMVPDDQRPGMDKGLLACAERGARLSATDLLDAFAERAALYEIMRRFHERYDAMITPTMPLTAIETGIETPRDGSYGDNWFDWSPFTWPFNVTGQPGASVPVALDRGGLPIGLQIIGRWREEATLIRIARAVEILSAFPRLDAPIIRP